MSDSIIVNVNPASTDLVVINSNEETTNQVIQVDDGSSSTSVNIQPIAPQNVTILTDDITIDKDINVNQGGDVFSVNGKIGHVILTKNDFGLSAVDNTSDLNKPVSYLTLSALALKADLSYVSEITAAQDVFYRKVADQVRNAAPTVSIVTQTSGKWNEAYDNLATTSAFYLGISGTSKISWDSVYSTTFTNSSFWTQAYTNLTSNSAFYVEGGKSDSKFLALSGGSLFGRLNVLDLSAYDPFSDDNSVVKIRGPLSIGDTTKAKGRNSFSGGLSANAIFDNSWIIKLSPETEILTTSKSNQFLLSAAGGVFIPGQMGIGFENVLDDKLLVGGSIRTTDIFYDKNGNSNLWNSVYSYVNQSSANEKNQQEVVSFILSNSSNILNVNTKVNITSSNWDSVYSIVQSSSTNWEESSEIIPTVTNYLSTNGILISSLNVSRSIFSPSITSFHINLSTSGRITVTEGISSLVAIEKYSGGLRLGQQALYPYFPTFDFSHWNLSNVNTITISDPGANEGLNWGGTNASWIIDVSPLNRTNSDGNLNLFGRSQNVAIWRPTLLISNSSQYSVFTPQAGGGLNVTTIGDLSSNITFTPSGNFGIGILNPNEKLTIVGNISTRDFLSSREWASSYTSLNNSSGLELNVRTYVNSNSSNINNVLSRVNTTSANWNSVYNTWNVTSGLELNVRTYVNSNSSNINNVLSRVNTTSANWNSVYNTWNNTSGLELNVRTYVNSNSSNILNVNTIVNNTSANWDSVYSYVNQASGNEANQQNVVSFILSNSSNIINVNTKVNNTSSAWDSVYNHWNSNSAELINVGNFVKNTSANNSVFITVCSLSSNWNSVYSSWNNTSSLELNSRTYVNNNSSRFENLLSTVSSTSSTFATITFSDSKYVPLTSIDKQLNANSTNTVTNSAITNRILQIENSLNILVPAPTYTAPAATLTNFSTTVFEVGQNVTASLTLGYTQNDGGTASFYRLEKNSTLVQEQATAFTRSVNETAVLGLTRYTCIVTHLSGAVKNNAIGLPDPRGVITAGTKSINRDYNAYYRQFHGSVNTLPTSPSLVRNLTGLTFTTTNSFTFYVYTRNIAIAIPSSRQLVSIITGSFENLTTQFNLSSTQVPDAGGTPRDYKLYTYTTVNPYNSNFTITLS